MIGTVTSRVPTATHVAVEGTMGDLWGDPLDDPVDPDDLYRPLRCPLHIQKRGNIYRVVHGVDTRFNRGWWFTSWPFQVHGIKFYPGISFYRCSNKRVLFDIIFSQDSRAVRVNDLLPTYGNANKPKTQIMPIFPHSSPELIQLNNVRLQSWEFFEHVNFLIRENFCLRSLTVFISVLIL